MARGNKRQRRKRIKAALLMMLDHTPDASAWIVVTRPGRIGRETQAIAQVLTKRSGIPIIVMEVSASGRKKERKDDS